MACVRHILQAFQNTGVRADDNNSDFGSEYGGEQSGDEKVKLYKIRII